MILKKPYAFLIKYFRVIHFILLFFLVNYMYSGRSVLQFFNTYVKNNYQTAIVNDLHKYYAPLSLLIIVAVIIIISAALLGLMVHKKKPYKLYLFILLYYILIFAELIYVRGVLISFSESLLSATAARSLRDILVILSLPQFVFAFLVFLRAIGFDFKKFDFASDLRKMDYSYKDAEEFELNLNLDMYKVERKSRRILRELVYYVKENRFVVICLSVVVGIVFLGYVRNNVHSNYDVTYGMNRTFVYNKMNFTIQDAVVSELDYRGNKIEGKVFLALKINASNNSGTLIHVDYDNFKLELGTRLINPTITDAKYFIDIASNIVPMTFSHLSERTFVLVYEISERDINKIKRIVIHNGVATDKGTAIDKHIFVNLKVTTLSSDIEIQGNYSLNEKVVFEKSYLRNTSLRVKNYSIYKRYIYKYRSCISTNNCGLFDDMLIVDSFGTQNNVILVFETIYDQDMDAGYSLTNTSLKAFSETYCTIQYRVEDKIYTSEKSITPQNATDFIAFEVPQNIEYADLIQLIVTVRNKRYFVVINP